MSDDVKDIVIPILRQLQLDMGTVKEHLGSINMRLVAVESHMSGFMASSRYFDTELDALRGRVEALEERNKDD